MIKKIRLKNFKSFQDAELILGNFSVLIGTNASGKSNVLEAFRFLNGLSKPNTIAQILLEERRTGWPGIRGGIRETTYQHADSFQIEVEMEVDLLTLPRAAVTYLIAVCVKEGSAPYIQREHLTVDGETVLTAQSSGGRTSVDIVVKPYSFSEGNPGVLKEGAGVYRPPFDSPYLSSVMQAGDILWEIKENNFAQQIFLAVEKEFAKLSFLNFNPAMLREASEPFKPLESDGGNLPTAVQKIIQDHKKDALIQWLQALTPQDIRDVEILQDTLDRNFMQVTDRSGLKLSAKSLSDGTLRFLGYLAAFLNSESESSIFLIDELENGIHPTRLHVLVDLIEQECKRSHIQVVATTHSPQILNMLSEENLLSSSIFYRVEDQEMTFIQSIGNFSQENLTVIKEKGAGRLLESGWFENVLSFIEGDLENESANYPGRPKK